jgi:hypothetical protein
LQYRSETFDQSVLSAPGDTVYNDKDRDGNRGHEDNDKLPEKPVVSPDELLSALKRYLAESGDTEEAVASQIGVNHHTLRRWLSER